MIITCPKCETRLNLPDGKLKPEGTRFKCGKCGTSHVYKAQPLEPAPEKPLEPQLAQPLPAGEAETSSPTDISAPVTENAKQSSSSFTILGRIISRKASLAGAAGLLIVALGAVFFLSSDDKGQGPVPWTARGSAPPHPSGQGPAPQGTSTPSADKAAPHVGDPAGQPAATTPAAMSPERAIEMVKHSEALMKMTTVESIVKKWTEENAGKYKIVGWQAKKVDDRKYFISYTAMDGDMPKGFYFDLDAQTGVVQDLAHNPELQKKYNIQYNN